MKEIEKLGYMKAFYCTLLVTLLHIPANCRNIFLVARNLLEIYFEYELSSIEGDIYCFFLAQHTPWSHLGCHLQVTGLLRRQYHQLLGVWICADCGGDEGVGDFTGLAWAARGAWMYRGVLRESIKEIRMEQDHVLQIGNYVCRSALDNMASR